MNKDFKILIACEFSGIVRDAFIERGFDATSCDLLPTEIPGKHIQGDVLEVLNDGWDLMIAHPPCTYLSNAGGHYLNNNSDRIEKMIAACDLFNKLLHSNIPMIAIENPIQHGHARRNIRKYDQKIQPFHFGQKEKKTICLWLKNLPYLMPTNIVTIEPKGMIKKTDGRNYYYWYHQGKSSKERARFFPGIAKAIATQYGDYLIQQKSKVA